MKKTLLLTIVVLLTVATGAFAAKGGGFAIGAEVASTNFASWGGMLNLHFTEVPLHLAIGAYGSPSAFGLDTKVDYWLLHGNLVSGIDWYIGIGGYIAVQVQPGATFSLGVRAPFALQIWPSGQLVEIFLEVAPAWIPFTNGGISAGNLVVQPALGFRIWF